ncbi:toll/interleukin-1 receptor domain-containing protein [Streptomyces sp. GTA36]
MQSDSREAEDAYFALLERLSRRIAEARRIRLSTLDADELPRVRSAFGRLPLTRQTTSPRTPVYTGSYTEPGGGYGSRAPSPPVSIAISYVGADQPWADWMAEVLERDGHPSVTQVRWETERESLSETVDRAHRVAERVIALFSRTYFTAWRDRTPRLGRRVRRRGQTVADSGADRCGTPSAAGSPRGAGHPAQRLRRERGATSV